MSHNGKNRILKSNFSLLLNYYDNIFPATVKKMLYKFADFLSLEIKNIDFHVVGKLHLRNLDPKYDEI